MTDKNKLLTPYKPKELGRLFWLAAKHIAVADPEFSSAQNGHFALALYSGCRLKHIRTHDVVDMVVRALGEYYEFNGINSLELTELFKTLRTDYSWLTSQKWNQDEASEKIISACMCRFTLAQIRDGDTVLVDLSGPEVNYDEVWERLRQEEKEDNQEETARIHKYCKGDGMARCFRPFESEWLLKITDAEKQNMRPDECLCEQAQNRPIKMICDFKIDDSSEPVEIEFQ